MQPAIFLLLPFLLLTSPSHAIDPNLNSNLSPNLNPNLLHLKSKILSEEIPILATAFNPTPTANPSLQTPTDPTVVEVVHATNDNSKDIHLDTQSPPHPPSKSQTGAQRQTTTTTLSSSSSTTTTTSPPQDLIPKTYRYKSWGFPRRAGETHTITLLHISTRTSTTKRSEAAELGGEARKDAGEEEDEDEGIAVGFIEYSLQWFPRPLGRQTPLLLGVSSVVSTAVGSETKGRTVVETKVPLPSSGPRPGPGLGPGLGPGIRPEAMRK